MFNQVRQLTDGRSQPVEDPEEEELHGPPSQNSPGDFAALFARKARLPLRSFLPERRVWTAVAAAATSVVLLGGAGYGLSGLYELVSHQGTSHKETTHQPSAPSAQMPASHQQPASPSSSSSSSSPSPSPTPQPAPKPNPPAQAPAAPANPQQNAPQAAPVTNFLSMVGTPRSGDSKYTMQNLVIQTSVPLSSLTVQVRISGNVKVGSRTFSTINSQGTFSGQVEPDGSLDWMWTTKPGVTLGPGQYTFGADYWINNGGHDVSGDTYTVTATSSSGVSQNLHGSIQ
jgi:hypothetical protein